MINYSNKLNTKTIIEPNKKYFVTEENPNKKKRTIEINNPIMPPISKFAINFSPRLINALEKAKNYKFRLTKYNYLRILNSHIKNSFFSNTNNNCRDYSLNNICSVEVAR